MGHVLAIPSMQDRPQDAWVSGLAFLDQATDFVAMQFQSFGRLHWLYRVTVDRVDFILRFPFASLRLEAPGSST
jgi:hypothetical protein